MYSVLAHGKVPSLSVAGYTGRNRDRPKDGRFPGIYIESNTSRIQSDADN
jgi:hypothetical protein